MANLNRGFAGEVGGSVGRKTLAEWFKSLRRSRGVGRYESPCLYGPLGSGAAIEMVGPSDADEVVFEALGYDWFSPGAGKFVTQAHQARPAIRALVYRNWDGSAFQVAIEVWSAGQWVSLPVWAKSQTRKVASGKYLCPRGESYRPVWLPPLPDAIRRKVGKRYGLAVPSAKDCPNFWDWAGRNLPAMAVTEGPHKSASMLSDGVVMVAAAGVDALVYGSKFGDRQGRLRDEVAPLLEGRDRITVAFDSDPAGSKGSHRVGCAINRVRRAIRDLKGGRKTEFLLADWDNAIDGKGIDDVRRARGLGRVLEILQAASPWESIVARRAIANRLTREPDLVIQLREGESAADRAGEIAQAALGRKLVAVAGSKGVGKSELIAQLSAGRSFLSIYHRVSLARAMALTARAAYRTDIDSALGRAILEPGSRVSACIDGAISTGASGVSLDFLRRDGALSLDELEQLFSHVLGAGTLGDRAVQARSYLSAAAKTASAVIAASADLNDWSLNLLESLAADATGREQAFLVKILGWRESWAGEVAFVAAKTATDKTLAAALAAIDRGERVIVLSDSRKSATTIFESLKDRISSDWQPGQVPGLLVTADTSASADCVEFLGNPDKWIAAHPEFRLLVYSPSIGSGVSIKKADAFDRVIGLSVGTIGPEDFAQMLDRFRPNVPRQIFTLRRGLYQGKFSGSWNADQALTDQRQGAIAAAQVSGSEDVYRARGAFDTENPWNQAQAAIDADLNLKASLHGHYLIELLRHEGKSITVTSETGKLSDSDKELLEKIKEEITQKRVESILAANRIDEKTAQAYDRLESKTDAQRWELERFKIESVYQIDLSEMAEDEAADWIVWDKDGRKRRAAIAFSQLRSEDAAKDVDNRAIDRAIKNPDRLTAGDVGKAQLRSRLRRQLRIDELLALPQLTNDHPTVEWVAKLARQNQNELRIALGVSIGAGHSNTQIVGSLLRGLGVEIRLVKQCGAGEARGQRVYEISQGDLTRLEGIAARREQQRLDRLAANKAAADSMAEPIGDEVDMLADILAAVAPETLMPILAQRYGAKTLMDVTPEQIRDFWEWWRLR